MDPKFQTSFIPKKPVVASQGTTVPVVRETNLLSIIATVLFVATLATAGGLFYYKESIQKQIAEYDKSLTEAEAAFQPEKIKELVDAHAAIVASKNLVEKHTALSEMLLYLQQLTLRRMRFNELSYKKTEEVGTLLIHTEVQTYNALAQQYDIFSKTTAFKNLEFSGFTLQENGVISIDFTSVVDPALTSYKRFIEQSVASNTQ